MYGNKHNPNQRFGVFNKLQEQSLAVRSYPNYLSDTLRNLTSVTVILTIPRTQCLNDHQIPTHNHPSPPCNFFSCQSAIRLFVDDCLINRRLD